MRGDAVAWMQACGRLPGGLKARRPWRRPPGSGARVIRQGRRAPAWRRFAVGSIPVQPADPNPEREPGDSNPTCASLQIVVGPPGVPCRRRDVPAVVLGEIDPTPDSLPGQPESHKGDLSRPFHHGCGSARAAKARDDAVQLNFEPLPIVGRPNLLDAAEQVVLDGDVRRVRPGTRGPTAAPQRECDQPGRRPAEVHQPERSRGSPRATVSRPASSTDGSLGRDESHGLER